MREGRATGAGQGTGPVLGLLVPCRNEGAVIARRLANLARQAWPDARAPHRVLVVDDGSEDGTADRARAALDAMPLPSQVRSEVVANARRPGKGGAIETGLAILEDHVDLVVLTDADVVCDDQALLALARAFARDPRLVLACGAQRFVAELPADGAARRADGSLPPDVGTAYDRVSAWVRRRESARGRLFSVHGQLLAWRAELRLAPRRALAADDLELMLAARERVPDGRIELVPSALFLEQRTFPGPDARAQALRRARAYVQLVREHPGPAGGASSRIQWALYRRLPLAFPWFVAGVCGSFVLASLLAAWPWNLVAAAVLALALVSAPGRRALDLALTIRRAARAEGRERLSDRWEMARR